MTKRKQPIDKPFASGTMTKAAFFSFIRSALRQKSRRWKPIYSCLASARRPSKSKNKRLKYEYRCELCKGWFKQADVSVDHVVPVGSLNKLEDLPGFVQRLFCEEDGLRVLCDGCHKEVTDEQRQAKQKEKND